MKFINKCLFDEEAEAALYKKYSEVCTHDFKSYKEELNALLNLKPELDRFFEEVMVNVEDEAIKNNRKYLIASIYKSILKIADIKEVSI